MQSPAGIPLKAIFASEHGSWKQAVRVGYEGSGGTLAGTAAEF
jgi:hypothetical protein